uniref:Uncharacterized protein n=1 Tax=Cucumis melo TaxID=3656 RepID=A0A9I9E0H8_CUCME
MFVCHQFSSSPQHITRFHRLLCFQFITSSSANSSSHVRLLKLLSSPYNVHHQFDQPSRQTFFLPDDHLVCSTDDYLVRITQTTIWYVLRPRIRDDHLVHSLAAYHRCTRRTFLGRTSYKSLDILQPQITETSQ